MNPKAFVYTELQISIPFAKAPWRDLNPVLRQQPGLLNKVWLSGVGNYSVGGFYTFDSIENAQKFALQYFPGEARKFGVPQTTRIFDAVATAEASRELNSVHFGHKLAQKPGAYLYTEVQLSLAFDQVPWRDLNPMLRQQEGLLAKTWLSGISTQSVGGFYAFDNVKNATAWALDGFPREVAGMHSKLGTNPAFTTRLFDATVTEEASRELNSPFAL